MVEGPLTAAREVQNELAEASSDCMKKVGLDDSEKLLAMGDELEQAVKTVRKYESRKTHVNVPLLGLVKLPGLLVDDTEAFIFHRKFAINAIRVKKFC